MGKLYLGLNTFGVYQINNTRDFWMVNEKDISKDGWGFKANSIIVFSEKFEKVTGIVLKPGELVELELRIKKIEGRG